MSLFETCIRELGGLLSAFDLSGDRMFLEKSEDLALRLLRGFGSESGLPYATINLKTYGFPHPVPRSSRSSSLFARFGVVGAVLCWGLAS